ncbi:MAG: D-alanyl-D-alanine carboxypeptidase [Clostridia bacterium]|nr:D-alanyl-D-alanine carboxypeptidase [Clostridia bacterium]
MKRLLALFLLTVLICPGASASEPFTVEAKGAVLIDADSGRILFGQNENEMLPMASTTKIMTALIAIENADLEDTVTTGKNASGVEGTSMYLSVDEALSMEHMLYGLMLRSGNDAAVAIAEHVAGSVSKFADLMNARASELNADAHFVNPHGLDADGHKASALGLAKIMREAMKHESFRTITGTSRKVVPWVGNEYSRVLQNKNRLLTDYEGAIGGKTGYTGKAGRCLVFCAERDGLTLIGAVLNCPSWFDTAERLLDYGFENFRTENAFAAGTTAAVLPVTGGELKKVDILTGSALVAAVDVDSETEILLNLPESAPAPVYAGQVMGKAQIKTDGIVIAQCDLVAAIDVPKRSVLRTLIRILRNWTGLLPAEASS